MCLHQVWAVGQGRRPGNGKAVGHGGRPGGIVSCWQRETIKRQRKLLAKGDDRRQSELLAKGDTRRQQRKLSAKRERERMGLNRARVQVGRRLLGESVRDEVEWGRPESMRAKPRHVQQCRASWELHPLSQQGTAKRSRTRSNPGTYLLGRPIAQKEPTSVERHHTAETAGRTVHSSADPLTASLLERKQVKNICIHNIPERGV